MTDRTERMLMEDSEEYGFTAMRAPASGARDAHEGGDIWIAREHPAWAESGTELFMVEEKYKKGKSKNHKYARVRKEKINGMIETAEEIGAIPAVAVRWSTRCEWSPGSTHWIGDARDIDRTDSGNISLSPAEAESKLVATDDFFGQKVIEAGA